MRRPPDGWLTEDEWCSLPEEMRALFVASDESTMWYRPDDRFEAFGQDVTWIEPQDPVTVVSYPSYVEYGTGRPPVPPSVLGFRFYGLLLFMILLIVGIAYLLSRVYA